MVKLLQWVLVLSVVFVVRCGGGGSGSKITGDNYLKIKNGMNHSQVTVILGQPTEKEGEYPLPRIWTWKDGSKEITVVIDGNGSVDASTQKGLD